MDPSSHFSDNTRKGCQPCHSWQSPDQNNRLPLALDGDVAFLSAPKTRELHAIVFIFLRVNSAGPINHLSKKTTIKKRLIHLMPGEGDGKMNYPLNEAMHVSFPECLYPMLLLEDPLSCGPPSCLSYSESITFFCTSISFEYWHI